MLLFLTVYFFKGGAATAAVTLCVVVFAVFLLWFYLRATVYVYAHECSLNCVRVCVCGLCFYFCQVSMMMLLLLLF